jgi:hypothetical protein
VSTYRVGRHHGVTIVREGERTAEGHFVGADELVAVVTNGDAALAERICALLNADMDATPRATQDQINAARGVVPMTLEEARQVVRAVLDLRYEPADSCTCTVAGPDPACVVHQGRRARGPKPPNPPGCICDGSGRTCPRHGAVI